MDESSTEPLKPVGHRAFYPLDAELVSALLLRLSELNAEIGSQCCLVLIDPAIPCLRAHSSPDSPARFKRAMADLDAAFKKNEDARTELDPPLISAAISGERIELRMKSLAEAHGLRHCSSEFIWDGQGKWVGLIAAFDDHEQLSLIRGTRPLARMAQLAAVAIDRHGSDKLERVRRAAMLDKARALEATFERMELGLMVVSPQRIVELCNRKAAELLDLPTELMAAKPTFAAVLEYQWSKEEFAHTPEDIREFVRGGGILDTPHRYQRVRPNGIVIEVDSVPIDGGGVLRTYTDITDRERDAAALRVSNERLQRALDASRLALWDLDLTTGAVYLSDAWAEMLGSGRNETHTTFDALTALVPDDDQALIAEAMSAAFRGLNVPYSVEHRVRRPDGGMIWVHSQGRAVERSAEGRILRAVGTNCDISERKRSETAQRSLENQLREAQRLEAVGTLAGGIAHDFNNIVGAILGNAAIAREELEASHPAQLFLDQIEKAGRRARSIVKQILTFSRQQQEDMITLSVRPIVEETVSMLRSMVGGSVHIHETVPDQRVAVIGNPTQLQQVFMNLGTNAWQALREGAGNITIGLTELVVSPGSSPSPPAGLPRGSYAHVWVQDDGLGMSKETLHRIFEPFFTTKEVGKGTGLGLAVARGIIHAHGGFIEVDSAEGKGTTFNIYLPLVDLLSAPMPLELDSHLVMRGQGQHVLYVDDDEVMALMVDGLLKRLGYRSTCILDAREAIAIASRDSACVDLVVTDYNMPGCSGIDLALAVSRSRPGLPVAMSSGYISDDLRQRAAEVGVFSVMQKERTLEDLGELVAAALRSRR